MVHVQARGIEIQGGSIDTNVTVRSCFQVKTVLRRSQDVACTSEVMPSGIELICAAILIVSLLSDVFI